MRNEEREVAEIVRVMVRLPLLTTEGSLIHNGVSFNDKIYSPGDVPIRKRRFSPGHPE